jgi:hypothetical protein
MRLRRPAAFVSLLVFTGAGSLVAAARRSFRTRGIFFSCLPTLNSLSATGRCSGFAVSPRFFRRCLAFESSLSSAFCAFPVLGFSAAPSCLMGVCRPAGLSAASLVLLSSGPVAGIRALLTRLSGASLSGLRRRQVSACRMATSCADVVAPFAVGLPGAGARHLSSLLKSFFIDPFSNSGNTRDIADKAPAQPKRSNLLRRSVVAGSLESSFRRVTSRQL